MSGIHHELLWHWRASWLARCGTLLLVLCLGAAWGAPWLAPHQPFDLSTLELADAHRPPVWLPDGEWRFLLGTDDQGRDLLSATLFGARLSLAIAFTTVLLSMALGVMLGVLSGYVGGVLDMLLMRVCDMMLSFPAILVALLVDGLARAAWPQARDGQAFGVLVLSMVLTGWVPYARTVRAAAMVERNKDYVAAARLCGTGALRIMGWHVLPNAWGAAWVLATLQVAQAIQIEAALSYLGVGVPPTEPSLGTLIRVGQEALFSGAWWVTVVPGGMLVLIALGVNLVGDWLRDATQSHPA